MNRQKGIYPIQEITLSRLVKESNEGTEQNACSKRKREDQENEKEIEKVEKINDEMKTETFEAPTITTSWRQAIGSSE